MLTWKLRLSAIFAVILVGCAVGWFFLGGNTPAPSGPVTGTNQRRKAPEFALKDHAGQIHKLGDFQGKLTIVHFWASWCPPCLTEIPELVEFAEHFKDDPRLRIVAISLDDGWEAAEKVLQTPKLPKNMISLLDGGAKTPDAYGTYQYPESYLVSPKGEIIAKWIGGQPWASSKTEELMPKEMEKEGAK